MKKFLKLFLFFAIVIFSVTRVNAIITDITFEVKDPDCAGDSTGYVIFKSFTSVAPTGPTYSFRFNFPSSIRISINVGDTIKKLVGGNYFIDIIDNGFYFRAMWWFMYRWN